jgi:hypothetical protein
MDELDDTKADFIDGSDDDLLIRLRNGSGQGELRGTFRLARTQILIENASPLLAPSALPYL